MSSLFWLLLALVFFFVYSVLFIVLYYDFTGTMGGNTPINKKFFNLFIG